MEYLTKHRIINNHQYGFILELTNEIFDLFEKNETRIGKKGSKPSDM